MRPAMLWTRFCAAPLGARARRQHRCQWRAKFSRRQGDKCCGGGRMVFRFLLVLPFVLWAATSLPCDAQTASESSDEPAQRLIGTWGSNDPRRASVKTFRPDGTYTEVLRLLGARAMVTGIYRLQGETALAGRAEADSRSRGGDVRPPTGHVRLKEEQRVKIKWNNADELVILSDRSILYRRGGRESYFDGARRRRRADYAVSVLNRRSRLSQANPTTALPARIGLYESNRYATVFLDIGGESADRQRSARPMRHSGILLSAA